VVQTPIRAPRANAFAERWVCTARRECLDHLLIFGRRHLEGVRGAYGEQYNRASEGSMTLCRHLEPDTSLPRRVVASRGSEGLIGHR
jgi:hypothetical protein